MAADDVTGPDAERQDNEDAERQDTEDAEGHSFRGGLTQDPDFSNAPLSAADDSDPPKSDPVESFHGG